MRRECFYEFNTARFSIRAYVEPELMAPDFDDDETMADIEAGRVEWFAVSVEVSKNWHVIGRDHLGGCAYSSVSEFFTAHRDADPMNRNCSLMRKAMGGNRAIRHYFPSMVSEAIADARRTLCDA